jgi:hypothetical protein
MSDTMGGVRGHSKCKRRLDFNECVCQLCSSKRRLNSSRFFLRSQKKTVTMHRLVGMVLADDVRGVVELLKTVIHGDPLLSGALNENSGFLLLHKASSSQMVHTLVERGVPVQPMCHVSLKESALHVACRNGKLEVARALLELRADPNIRTVNRSVMPLHSVFERGHASFATHMTEDLFPVIENVRQARRVPIVDLLLSYGASVDAFDFCGHTPIALAAQLGDYPCVSLMMQKQAEAILKQDIYGCTALHIVLDQKAWPHLEAQSLISQRRFLLEFAELAKRTVEEIYRIAPSQLFTLKQNWEDHTPFMVALRNIFLDVSVLKKVMSNEDRQCPKLAVQCLVESSDKWARLARGPAAGWTALMENETRKNLVGRLRFILRNIPKLRKHIMDPGSSGFPPLLHAVNCNHTSFVEALVEVKCTPLISQMGTHEKTVFHYCNSREMLQILLEKYPGDSREAIRSVDSDGLSTLHAVTYNCRNVGDIAYIMGKLVCLGAPLDQRERFTGDTTLNRLVGCIFLDEASSPSHEPWGEYVYGIVNAATFLLELGANSRISNSEEITPLQKLCSMKRSGMDIYRNPTDRKEAGYSPKCPACDAKEFSREEAADNWTALYKLTSTLLITGGLLAQDINMHRKRKRNGSGRVEYAKAFQISLAPLVFSCTGPSVEDEDEWSEEALAARREACPMYSAFSHYQQERRLALAMLITTSFYREGNVGPANQLDQNLLQHIAHLAIDSADNDNEPLAQFF